jgi:hypothetical protein
MGRHVAVEDSIVPSSTAATFPPGAVAPTPPSAGWTNTGVTPTPVDHLKVDTKKVLRGATCTFNFSGTDSNGVTVTASATATLSPGATTLKGGGNTLLLNGDSAADAGGFNNTLTVVSTAILDST